MTADEFIRVYGEDDENRFELIDGEVWPRPVTGSPHDIVKNNLKELFDRSGVDRRVFRFWIEHTFRLGDSSLVTPDLAIARTEQVLHRRGFSDGSPAVPVEVVVHDSSARLQQKITAYLRNGAIAVCCAFPDSRNLVVYTAHEWRELTESDSLDFPALLPGISIPVSAIFEGI
jgi:Uma2 family endonuclease